MNTPRRLVLRSLAAAALLAVSTMAGPVGLTNLPRAHASCGGWQYIAQNQLEGANIYLIRDACNNTFAYSDNAPANSTVSITMYLNHTLPSTGKGPLQSPSFAITCGRHYLAELTLPDTNFGFAPISGYFTYC